jgi:hypothetical protein
LVEFLSVHEVRKIAVRKGYAIERNSVAKNVTYVRLIDPNGRQVEGLGTFRGLTLAAAKRLLEALPDLVPTKHNGVRRTRGG